jgi:glycosyltransferase involved in cell wall biosynthesis
MRFKNKSNAGRSFVFHQLGIPVVADITPSHFHVMGNPDCGFLVADKAGWYKALLKLTNYRTRQEIADNAKKEFDRLYDPHDWARKLYREIEEI